MVKNLKVLAAYAEKKGVQICVEPLNRFETDRSILATRAFN